LPKEAANPGNNKMSTPTPLPVPSTTPPLEAPESWLAKKTYDELSLQFRTVWDIYIKWYTVFLSVNVLALGAVVQYVHQENRWIIVLSFVIQNVLGLGTAVMIARFSAATASRIETVIRCIVSPEIVDGVPRELRDSPIPGKLGAWSGYANAIGNAALIAGWIALPFIPTVPVPH
jgi:hypothetical protein